MSHTRVKTTFEQEGSYASSDVVEIYCHHNHSSDFTTFYYKDGSVVDMFFQSWGQNDKFDAIQRLWFPFKDAWGGELKEGVEYYQKGPWEA